MKSEPVDLSAVVRDVLDSFLARISEKLNALWSDFDPAIHFLVLADGTQLRSVLAELVGNAWKFTDQGEIILTVRLLGPGEESAEIEFSVEDTGPGMDPAIIAKLSAPESVARDPSAHESGLFVLRRIVSEMGGVMRISNRGARGCMARFTIEFQKAIVGVV